jgi:hypothetical protein
MNEGGGSVESSRGSPSPPILPDKATMKSKTWYWVLHFMHPQLMNEGGEPVESSRGSPSPPILPYKATRKSKTWYWVSAFHAPTANE